jgi:amino acid transporter
VESASVAAGERGAAPATSEHGLKANAIGLLSGVAIGVDSTAPAYSLAAVIAGLVVAVGVQAPAIMLLAFVPMVCVAGAYYYMNKVDPDCGTTFAWATRALGPTIGWVAGWSILSAGIIVIGSLADVASLYTFLLFDWESAAGSKNAVTALAVFYIVLMAWIAIRGIEISAELQIVLVIAQVVALVIFAIAALFSNAPAGGDFASVNPEGSWFSPFAVDGGLSAVTAGLLIAIFIYWGWDSAVAVNEESRHSHSGPGRAALVSTVVLLGIYLLVSTAIVSYAGPGIFEDFLDDTAIFDTVAADVLGDPWDKIVVLAVLTSALAATQTTILPASRTSLSMARAGALSKIFGEIHPRFLTPAKGTAIVSALAVIFYVLFNLASQNFLFDAITALGFLIAVNYGLNGLACVVYHRRTLGGSAKRLFLIGIAPLIGSLIFGYIFVKAAVDYSKAESSYLGQEWLGYAPPAVIGVGLVILGIVLAVVLRFVYRDFFARKPQAAAPGETAGVPTEGV